MPKSALIVDDNQGIRILLEELLTREGCVVKSAASGNEALGILQSYKPSIIFLDMKMPGMSCVEVVEKIMAMDRTLPIVIISAYDDNQALAKIYKICPHIQFISKPFDIFAIRALINQI